MFLLNELATIPIPGETQSEEELGRKIGQLTDTIQKTIIATVPVN